MSTFNPACYLPSAVSNYLPSAVACPPPPSYFGSVYNTFTSPFSSTFTTFRTMLDALVSLPMLSFLLIPTMSSYSTSLNLLFFYLTWSTLVLSHPPLRVELVATLAVRILFYILPSFLFLAFDYLLPSAAESMKSQGRAGLPLRRATRSRAVAVLRILGWSIANTLLAVSAQIGIEIFLTEIMGYRSALRVTTRLPLPWAIIKDLGRGYLLREMFTYCIHRYILHDPSNQLSNLHMEWYHSLPAPFPLSGSYDHPVPYLLHKFIPTYLPALLFRFHLLTYILYLILLSLEETFAYSGYSTVPTNFILGGIARRTDAHITCDGEGNYGCYGLVDWIMGTSVGGDLGDDLELEAEKHNLQERVERVGARGVRGVRRRVAAVTSNGSRNGNGRASGVLSSSDEAGTRRTRVARRSRS